MSEDEIKKVRNAEEILQKELQKRLHNTNNEDLKFIYIMLESLVTRIKTNYESTIDSTEKIKDLQVRLNKINTNKGI